MLTDSLRFLVGTLANFFTLVLLLRFYFQLARVPFNHPLAQFTVALTNFVVLPTRRFVPSIGGWDTSTLVLARLTELLSKGALLWLSPIPYALFHPQSLAMLALLAVLRVFVMSVYLLMGALVVMAVMSWVNPYNPLAPILEAFTRPYLRPFARFQVGSVDLGPLVLLLILQLITAVPAAQLEMLLLSQLKLAV